MNNDNSANNSSKTNDEATISSEENVSRETNTPSDDKNTTEEIKNIDPGVFAAIRKDSRKKGYEEGRRAALEELKKQQESNDDVDTFDYTDSSSTGEKPIDVEKVANDIKLQISIEQAHKATLNKYPNFNELAKVAEERIKYDSKYQHLLFEAYQFGDPDLIYSIVSNKQVRQDLLELNPNEWGDNFRNIDKSPTFKTPATPIDTIQTTPLKGSSSMSEKDLIAEARKLYNQY